MPRSSPLERRLLAAAFILGLAIRLVAFAQSSELRTPIVDEQQYSTIARNIVWGVGFAWDVNRPTSIRPPLFPGLLAGVWSITGVDNFQAIRLIQFVMWAVAALLVYWLGRRTFSPRVGAIAAAACWLYPSLIFFNFTILTETLFTTLLIAFLLASVTLVQEGRAWVAVACGIALGLAALTRSVLWPMPLVFCPLMFLLLSGTWQRRVVLVGLIFAGYLAVVTPWAIRNTRLQGVFEVVDTMSGMNLRMGNYEYTPDDRMWDAVAITGTRNWAYELGATNPGVTFTEGQKDKWAQSMAVKYMLAHPIETMRRSAIKFADFWGLEREYMAGIQQGLYHPPRWIGLVAPFLIVLGYVAVTITGAAGLWLAVPRWREHVLLLLPVLVITAAHTLAFGHSRYHIPLIPILALYGAALLTRPPAQWFTNRLAVSGAAFCTLLLAAIWGREVLFVEAARIRAFF